MIEFTTLGGLDLRDQAGAKISAVLVHPKRSALLAYLAIATPRGLHRRDTLMALLWPDLDQERGRASLRKAIHHVRRALGENAIAANGEDALGIERDRLRCDASAFEDSLDAGDLAGALALYRGPLLPGFFVDDAPEFERWLERERARLRDRAFDAAWRLAEQEERIGNTFDAAMWGRRASSLSPDDEAGLRRLISLLDRLGDRAGAVNAYERFAQQLLKDYEVEPSAETQALLRSVRNRGSGPASAIEGAAPSAGVAQVPAAAGTPPQMEAPAPASLRERTEAAAGAAAAVPAPKGKAPRALITRRVLAGLAAIVVVAIVVLTGLWRLKPRVTSAATPLSASTVAVLPFSFRGGPAFSYLAEGMTSLLGTSLDGVGGIHSVDANAVLTDAGVRELTNFDPSTARAIAARFGAGLYVLGDIVEVGGRLQANVALYDARKGSTPIARAAAQDTATNVFAIVDRLAAQLVAGQRPEAGARLTRLATVTTHSMPALKAYLEGERQFRIGHYKEATDAFQRAVGEDTTFALAYYRLALAYSWATDSMAHPMAIKAIRHAQHLSTPDRMLVEAFLPFVEGKPDEAERRYREILATRPFEGEAWYPLGEVLFHGNAERGRSIEEARPAFLRAISLGPKDSPLTHLLEIEAIAGNYTAFDSLLGGIARGSHFDLVGRTVRAFTRGSEDDRRRLLAEIRQTSDTEIGNTARHMLFLLDDRAAAARVVRLLVEPPRPREVQALGWILIAHLEMAAGRWRAGDSALTAAEQLDLPRALEHRGLLYSLPFLPIPVKERQAARRVLERWNPERTSAIDVVYGGDQKLHSHFRRYVIGLLAAQLADFDAAGREASEIERAPAAVDDRDLLVALARGIRARVAWEQGRTNDVVEGLQGIRLTKSPVDLLGVVPFHGLAPERFLRAEGLHALGREQEALGWYSSFGEHWAFGRVYLAAAHRRQGEIAEKEGKRDEAVRHYSRFIELWKDADPELRAMLADARERLERLDAGRRTEVRPRR